MVVCREYFHGRGEAVKVFQKERWATFQDHVEAHRIAAFCRTFGHARAVQKGLRNPMFVCGRCYREVLP